MVACPLFDIAPPLPFRALFSIKRTSHNGKCAIICYSPTISRSAVVRERTICNIDCTRKIPYSPTKISGVSSERTICNSNILLPLVTLFVIAPPTPFSALLSEKVLFVIVTVPELFEIAPPSLETTFLRTYYLKS